MSAVSGTEFLSGTVTGTLTSASTSACSAEGGFGNGPSAYVAHEQGVLSSVSISGTCSGSNNAFSSLSFTVNPFAGATNITSIDVFRFYWNGSDTAHVTFQFSSSGTSFFTSTGPYGYLLLNSTTAGSYPVHSTDDCIGGSGISAPGTGNCRLQVLPLPAGTAGAVAAAGTSGNTVTGLVNLSAPSTVVCPPAGALWVTGSASCVPGASGDIVTSLASGPSYLVISFGFSNPPNSYPGGDASFSVTLSSTAVW